MTFNGVIAVTLRYFIDFGKTAFQLLLPLSRALILNGVS